MKKFVKFLFPFVFLMMGYAGFQFITSNREEAPKLTQKASEQFVFVQKAQIKNEAPTIRLFGTVETPLFASLTAAVEADIADVTVLEGDSVQKQDLLISLNQEDIELDVQQRQAELKEIEALISSDRVRHAADKRALEIEKDLLDLTRNSVERAKRLVENNAGSQSTLDETLQNEARQQLKIIQREQAINDFPLRQQQLEALLNKTRAALERAKRDLERTNIKAPFDGRITEVMVTMGDRIPRGGKLLSLYNESELEVRAQVPFSFVPSLQKAISNNQQVMAQAIYENHRISLTLHRLTALIEQGQAGIDAFFRSSSSQLPALGSTLDILVYMPLLENVVVVPPDAIYSGNRVYVVINGTLEPREVNQIGMRIEADGSQAIILDGSDFYPDEDILTSRLPQAVSGLHVQILEQDQND
ncbi:MAG: HlyD family efflux transporter periplasmic adaptor subunit [Gammaproteobacteria bacterium]|nr:HlyD family efflux transporter periplasmic adaptor subunit [Gammaproteobacteria bacterium]MCY4228129.1 HlyD family efflux transporter periplasmic adaptor subunit [Gammaproteobacteria bacterium]MCY4314015.1 HlyD family efflux transporter periplasmic adaptor subunit [Gammaproteobacteria bacterium]